MDDGKPLTLPLRVSSAAESRSLEAHKVSETVDPYSVLVLETLQEEGIETPGWAEVRCSGPLMGYATFDYWASSGVTTCLLYDFPATFLLLYDHTEGRKVGVALANADHTSSASVAARIWDDSWTPLGAEEIPLPASGHASFLLADRFPVTADKRGTIEFRGASGERISGLAFHFDSDGHFYAIPVMSGPTAQ